MPHCGPSHASVLSLVRTIVGIAILQIRLSKRFSLFVGVGALTGKCSPSHEPAAAGGLTFSFPTRRRGAAAFSWFPERGISARSLLRTIRWTSLFLRAGF